MIKKIKALWIKFLKFIFKKWMPEEQSKEQVAQGLLSWVEKNRPSHFDFPCPVCGHFLTVKNIQEKHWTKAELILIYRCEKKCQFSVQRRFNFDLDEIKTM